MKDFLEIISQFKSTKSACKYVIGNSSSNNAPYHCFYHIMTVTKGCAEAASYYKLEDKKTEQLLIAALFHDFSHSQGKEKDSVNIQIAIKGFKKWVGQFPGAYFDRQNIIDIITITEFPYTVPTSSLTLEQKIIRDADMSQMMQPNWIQQTLFGLGQEMRKSFDEMVEGQGKFFESLKPCTEWFEEKWKSEKPRLLSELKILKNL